MTARHQPPYPTPAAFRRALTDRLRTIAAPHGPWPLADLQRQFAYDRLLTRLYLLDSAWILKGATAMLARGIAVRHTIDIDIYRAAQRDQVEQDVRTALDIDAGDCSDSRRGRPDRSRTPPPDCACPPWPGSVPPPGPASTST